MTYQLATAFDNEGGLAAMVVQPKTPSGIQTAERIWAVSGASFPEGQQFIDLVFTFMTPAEKEAFDAQAGISAITTSSEVTVRIRTNHTSSGDTPLFANYNGIIHYPERAERGMVGWEDLIYRVIALEALPVSLAGSTAWVMGASGSLTVV